MLYLMIRLYTTCLKEERVISLVINKAKLILMLVKIRELLIITLYSQEEDLLDRLRYLTILELTLF